MRLYSDRPDILTPGRWYRCADTAQPVGWTVFFARRNDLEDRYDPPLGEVYQPHYQYSKVPANPRLTGTTSCGSSSAWTAGILFGSNALGVGQNGIPLCCGIQPQTTLLLRAAGYYVRIGSGGLVLSSPTSRSDVAGVCTCVTASPIDSR
jgi:hypothetical protein